MNPQRQSYALPKPIERVTMQPVMATDAQRRVILLMQEIEQRGQQPLLVLQPDGCGNWRIHETRITK